MRYIVAAVLLVALFATAFAENTLMGIHSPNWSEEGLNEQSRFFGGKQGWLVDVVYSTDFDWMAGSVDAFRRAARRGFAAVVRFDYARPDATQWADGTKTFGATIPMQGSVGWCLARSGGPSRNVRDGTHLGCYLQYIEDFVRASPEVKHWLIGNEMNINVETKGFPGGKIDPVWYAEVYRQARALIKRIPGHENDIVYIGAVAPGDASAPRYHAGDDYLARVLRSLKAVDGVSIHAYGGWPLGSPASMDMFRPTYQNTVRTIDAAGFRSAKLIITEMSSHSDAARVHGSVQFLKDAIKSLAEWNWGGNHKISAAVWFVWDHPGYQAESINKFPTLKQTFTQLSQQYPAF